MNDFIELRRLFNVVLRRWWLLIGLTILGVATGQFISQRQIPVYEAKATILVGEFEQSINLNRDDVQMSELFAQTYSDLALRQPVLQGVVEILKLNQSWEELREQIQVSTVNGTQLIEIRVEATSPQLAESIANEIVKHLILIGPDNLGSGEGNIVQGFIHQQMNDTQMRILTGQERLAEIEESMSGQISSVRLAELQAEKTSLDQLIADLVLNYVELSNLSGQNKNTNAITIIETAYSDNRAVRPRVSLNMLLGGGLGLLLALGIAFLWEFADDTIRSREDLAHFGNLSLLGTVGRISGRRYSGKIISRHEPSAVIKESFRMIRNKIRLGLKDKPVQSIVITSPGPTEGKSLSAANLAIIMAQANIRTILVDADLRNPALHRYFEADNSFGLSDLLALPEINSLSFLKKTSVLNLQIITSGEPSENQADDLLSERILEIFDDLKKKAELIIIDSPPATLASDAAILSNRADSVIVVVRGGKTKRRELRQTLVDLQEANAVILGFIYNQAHKKSDIAVYQRQENNLLQRVITRLFQQ